MFKLVCGAGNEDCESVKRLVYIYAKAGCRFFDLSARKEILESIRYVDKVIKESNWEQKVDDIIKYNIDVFVIGDDWEGKFDFLKEYCEVVYLPRTKSISTTLLKEIIQKEQSA